MSRWKTLSSRIVYENPWMMIHEDDVLTPNGKKGMYGYAESKSDSVMVIPIDQDGNTYIVEQERYTLKKKTWEFVAGRTDNQPILEAAKRELIEETGYEASDIKELWRYHMAAGLSNFEISICLAHELKKVSDVLDQEDGILTVKKVSFAEMHTMIMTGEITSSQTIAGFFMMMSYLEQEKIQQA